MGLKTGKAKKRIRDFSKKVFAELCPSETLKVRFLMGKDMNYNLAQAEIDDVVNEPTITFSLSYIHDKEYKYSVTHEIAHIIHLRELEHGKMDDIDKFLICYDYHNPDWRNIYYLLASKFGLDFRTVQLECNRSRDYEVDLNGGWRKYLATMNTALTNDMKKRDKATAEAKEYRHMCRVNGWTLMND